MQEGIRRGSLFTKYTNVLILSVPQTTTESSGDDKQTGTRSSASVCYVGECTGRSPAGTVVRWCFQCVRD